MAVVQISRIQVRRGQKNTTGLPQLASGELAWAVDTQELYIGNGSVAEGAPAVGNTKILTQQDLITDNNILNLLQYQYKIQDPSIITGVDSNHPVMRSIQLRLDDRVSAIEFGAVPDGSDNTVALQRAINQLFLNATKASNTSVDGIAKRITLEIPAGKYVITDTLYIPSYATIRGDGLSKTIIEYQGSGNAIEFVNDSSVPGTPNVEATTSVNQPKFIKLSGMTIHSATSNTTCVYINSLTNSVLEDLSIQGDWTSGTTGSKGIDLNVLSTAITTENNLFNNISVSGFEYGVYSNSDIINNIFDKFRVTQTKRGFAFSDTVLDVGSTNGPRKNTISNSNFYNIKQQGVYIGNGYGNTVKDCKFASVGNDGGAVTSPLYPQVYFKQAGNTAINNQYDRQSVLAKITASPYIAEITGNGETRTFGTNRIALSSTLDTLLAFRLPVSTTDAGTPAGQATYIIDYTYHSSVSGFLRRGTMTLAADVSHNYTQLTDEYEYAGPSDPSGTSAIQLDFSVGFLTQAGNTYTGTGLPYSIAVYYTNPLSGDSGYLTYSYQTIFYREV